MDTIKVIIPIAIWIAWAILARLDIPVLSAILRTIWNFSFMLAAYIPFCGWMAHFIIAKGDYWREVKSEYVSIGNATDDATAKSMEEYSEKRKAELEAQQEEIRRKQEERKALEDELNASAYRKYGSRNVTLNSDGTLAKIGDGDYVSVEELKKDLY